MPEDTAEHDSDEFTRVESLNGHVENGNDLCVISTIVTIVDLSRILTPRMKTKIKDP
jgi:hypothetical protein